MSSEHSSDGSERSLGSCRNDAGFVNSYARRITARISQWNALVCKISDCYVQPGGERDAE